MSDRAGRNIMTEMEKRMAVLSDTEIRGVFDYLCNRNCCHNGDCRKNIGKNVSVSEAIKKIEDYRKYIWINPEELNNTTVQVQNMKGRDHRNVMLIDNLFQLRNPHDGVINYTIGYDKVANNIQHIS